MAKTGSNRKEEGADGKKERRVVPEGIAYIQATFNNTMISITDMKRQYPLLVELRVPRIPWLAQGKPRSRHSRRRPRAAHAARDHGMRTVHVRVKGPGSGRESAVRALASGGLEVRTITDVTPVSPQRVPAAPKGAACRNLKGNTPSRSREAPRAREFLTTGGLQLARYRDAVCRLCRRESVKLFLKGQRCLTDKCAIDRRNFRAGTARQEPSASNPGLRPATPGEAKAAPALRRAGGPVPHLFSRKHSPPRESRANCFFPCSNAASITRSIGWVWPAPARRRGSWCVTATSW